MVMGVTCPACGAFWSIDEEQHRSQVECQCGQSITLAIDSEETHTRPAPDLQTADSTVPKSIGQYKVGRKLGSGAMGVVYLGHDPKLQRDVAIKVLPKEYATHDERPHRFLREARSAAGLHHTNAAAVYEIGTTGQQTFIAMEYIDGAGLDATLSSSGPFSWREAARIVRDAAAGLGAAHEIGLVHRDVKPANLMRTKKGVTKVVDFGLARVQESQTNLTRAGTILGTPAYMAPEQWIAGDVDGRADLYSLTMTFYALLSGRPPFAGASVASLGFLHRYEPLPDPREHVPDLPDNVCRILARGSAKEPDERYQTAEELIADLDALLSAADGSQSTSCSWPELAGHSVADEQTVDQGISPAVRKETLDVTDAAPASVESEEETGGTGDEVVPSTEPVRPEARAEASRTRLKGMGLAGAFLIGLVLLFRLFGNYGNSGTVFVTVNLPSEVWWNNETWQYEEEGIPSHLGFESFEIRLDGEVINPAVSEYDCYCAFERTLRAGPHELTVEGPGIKSVKKPFTIDSFRDWNIRIELERRAADREQTTTRAERKKQI